jgi:HAD superfamily hydrolase (TIGR01549 family)
LSRRRHDEDARPISPAGARPAALARSQPLTTHGLRGSGGPARSTLPPAVLFDMDDTIFDHALTCRAALRELRRSEQFLQRRGLDAVWREYSRLLEAVHPDVLAGLRTPDDARTERFRLLATFCGTRITREEAEALSRSYRSHYQGLRRAVPGAKKLLERLHRRTFVGVVTNNQVAEQEEKLAYLGLRDLVDLLVVSEGVGTAKPDPRIFEVVLDGAGVGPSDAVMLGDSWENDVLGARATGIRAVWFNRFGQLNPEPEVVMEIRSLRDPFEVERVLSGPGPGGEGRPR